MACDDEAEKQWLPGMPVSEAQAFAMLDDLYAQLPAVECRGKCWDSCTDIDASELERRRLKERGIHLSEAPPKSRLRFRVLTGIVPRCPALTSFNTCGVYEARPFTCRAFGLVSEPGMPRDRIFDQAMMCDHGCMPEGTISLVDYVKTLDRIEMLSRAVTGVVRRQTMQEAADMLLRPKKRRR